MKARIPTPEQQQESLRKKGRKLIEDLRTRGWSDERIADALHVPFSNWKQFLINIGLNPFVKNEAKPAIENKPS